MTPKLTYPFLLFAASVGLQAASPAAAEDWPEFRGPTGQGHSSARGLPLEWSATNNVAWKQAVPGKGWSSPVVSGARVFLTTAMLSEGASPSLRALCLEVGTGRIVWDTEVFTPAESQAEAVHAKNTQASPTPIIEGDRLYVHFGHHGTACLDLGGKVIWRNHSLSYPSVHGNGGSPVLAEKLLIFAADGATDPSVIALDKTSGELVWKVARTAEAKQKFSFCTPLLISVQGQSQVILPGAGAVSAHDPKDGREIWRVRYGQGYSVVPRPVYGQGLVFVATGFNRADLLAIRPDGAGDVTDTHIAWRTTKGAPLTPSVLVVGEELYAVSDMGVASCFDAKTGTVHWQERIEGNYSASPLAAEDRIYFQNETGTAVVVKAGRVFEKLATNLLEERTLASYAVVRNSLLIRAEAHLYRISAAESQVKSSRE